MAQVSHLSFATTGTRGLRHDILPMRLYHKAKKLGVWDDDNVHSLSENADDFYLTGCP
jgi:ribonucleoside-diphosphate reductase beta chain